MAPEDLTALLVVLVAVLPGSVYTWAFERQASAYGVTFADRVLRFVAVSLAFHLVLAWPSFVVYRAIAPGAVSALDAGLAWGWSVVLVGLPAGVGTVVGGLHATHGTRAGWRWVRRVLPHGREDKLLRLLVGHAPAPCAWDFLFTSRPRALLRVLTVDGRVTAGWFGERSYAGSHPHELDLLLEQAWPIDADGAIGTDPLECAVYIPASQIARVDIYPYVRKEVRR